MVLHYCDTWKEVLSTWQIPESTSILNFEIWHKFDIPFIPPHPSSDQDLHDTRPPALRLREFQTQERLYHSFDVSL